MAADRDTTAHQVAHGHGPLCLAKTDDGDTPPGADACNRAAPGALHPDRVNRNVRRAGRHLVDRLVDGIGAEPLRERSPFRQRLDGGDLRAERVRRVDGEEADRPAPDDEHLRSCADRLEPERRDSGGERLYEDRVPRVEGRGDGQERLLRHHDPICEDAGAIKSKKTSLGAEVHLSAAARLTGAAADERENGVAALASRNGPDRLVSEDERRAPGPGLPAVRMEVRTADPGELDVEDDLALARLRVGKRLERERVPAVPDERLHCLFRIAEMCSNTVVHPLARAPERQGQPGKLAGIDRVLAALRILSTYPDGVALDQLARDLEAPKSSAHRALAALRRAGLAEQDAQGRYRLGLELVRLAFAHYEEREDYRLVEPALRALAESFHETAHYAELDGAEVVYVAKVNPAGRRVQMTSTVGGRNPAHCTGVGKALLAYALPNDEAVERFIGENGPLERRTPNTLVTALELGPELAAIRGRGFALDREESELGIGCIAFPVFLSSPSRPSGAISVSALVHLPGLADLEAAADAVRAVIHAHLGKATP